MELAAALMTCTNDGRDRAGDGGGEGHDVMTAKNDGVLPLLVEEVGGDGDGRRRWRRWI